MAATAETQPDFETLFASAMKLGDDDRFELAERLIESVPDDPEILAKQLEIAQARLDELRSGKVRGISGEEALRVVREKFQKRFAR